MFVYVLLGLFAVMCTLAVLLGAGFYRNVTDHASAHAHDRIVGSYIRSMVASRATEGGVLIEKGAEGDILVLPETFEDEALVTRIYCYEGMLTECFGYQEDEFEPDVGEPVCEAQSLSAEYDGKLLRVTVFDADGSEHRLAIAVPEGGAE
ncbi:MAG: DUF4860 domain-containing protein [Clostridia bacterium]|nr:DUF4860 domain-containing protein [Clostridia bacterium]